MSIKIAVHKADGMAGVEIPAKEICITERMPNINGSDSWVEEIKELYERDAELICDALFKSLPGGTIDLILTKMLTRKACLLAVPLEL